MVAGGVGVAVLVTVVSAFSPAGASGAALVPVFHRAFLAAALMEAIGVPFALAIRDSDAAATMRHRERGPAAEQPAARADTG